MRLPRPIRRLYYAHETLAKVSGVVIFLVVVASLYVAVLRTPSVTSIAVSATPTPTPTPSPTVVTPTPVPQTPTVVPTAAPPIPLGRYRVQAKSSVPYSSPVNLEERLDLCLPVGAAGLRPGVVLIHGDGFDNGNKGEYDPLCLAYASYGFVVATIDYRLAPQTTWPAPLIDAQLAVRWLRANASTYHLDPQRLCAQGDSAGASLSLFLGALTSNHVGDKTGLFSNQSPHVSCVVDLFAPVDLSLLTGNPVWQEIFPKMFGPGNQNSPVLLRDASPIFSINAQSVPTLIIQGTIDTVVPPSQSKALQTKLQSFGIPVTYISYPGGHGLDGLSNKQIQALTLQALSFLIAHENP
ncbi:MAG TPA: alpha/beta hydrolase [Ktedonobacterales bacterium]|nr:alpha/beta hydrolase [Ktedonobacterales bacterium]